MPADFFGLFETSQVGQTVEILIQARAVAQRVAPALAPRIHEIIIGMLADVNKAAGVMAQTADLAIVSEMLATQAKNRPFTGNMESHVHSLPGPLGTVGVAALAELDKIVNPFGTYGPFWRAQEFGTGTDEVPSQEGRPLFGTFEPSGTPPDAGQQGLGEGQDIAFFPRGSNPGEGTIHEELPGRHFLRHGYEEAGAKYLALMKAIGDQWEAEMLSVLADLKVQAKRRGGSFTGILHG